MMKDLISCKSSIDYKSLADYVSFIIQKITAEVITGLILKEFAIYVNVVGRFAVLSEDFKFH